MLQCEVKNHSFHFELKQILLLNKLPSAHDAAILSTAETQQGKTESSSTTTTSFPGGLSLWELNHKVKVIL